MIKKRTPALFLVLPLLTGALLAQERREAAAILHEYRSVTMPSMSRDGTPEGLRRFKEAIESGCRRQGKLAWELYASHPDHDDVPKLLSTRWAGMNNALGASGEVLTEVSTLLDRETRAAIRTQAMLAATRACLLLDDVPVERKVRMGRSACKVAPDDEHGPLTLLQVIMNWTSDPVLMHELCDEVLAGWSDAQWAGPEARGIKRQLDRIGQPLALAFEDALTKQPTTTASWRGQPFLVVVWSGGDANELTQLNELRRAHPHLRVLAIQNWRIEGGDAGRRETVTRSGLDDVAHYDASVAMKEPWSGPWAVNKSPLFLLADENGIVARVAWRVPTLATAVAESLRRKL